MTARKFTSRQKSMKSCYYLWLIRGMCLLTIRFMRRFGEIARLVVKTTPSAFTSATYGRSYIRHLPMLPSPSDLSGKLDIALRYKQKNKSQQSDPLRLLFFFFCCKSLLQWEVHLLLSSCQVPPFTKRAQLPLGGRWYFYTVTVSGSEKASCSCRPWHGTFAQ